MIITPDQIASLEKLITTPQWAVFKQIIKENDLVSLKRERDDMLSDDKSTLVEIKRIQYRINVFEEVLELPEKIIASRQAAENTVNPDPYYSSIKEIEDDV